MSDFEDMFGNEEQFQQALNAMAFIARTIRGYYENLLKEGFNANEALVLSAKMQDTLVGNSMKKGRQE